MATIAGLWQRFLSLLAAIVGLSLLFAMVAVSADVVGRYFLAAPIGWVLELTEYILLYTPFLGMAWLVRRALRAGG
jgi:TRAP-type C4-dicarboxylate transport system permease small subunit